MEGVDYGGVMVTGLLFSENQGWDQSPWNNLAWDTFGSARIKTLYGDGSTATYTFTTAPAVTDVYTIYYNGVRQTDSRCIPRRWINHHIYILISTRQRCEGRINSFR